MRLSCALWCVVLAGAVAAAGAQPAPVRTAKLAATLSFETEHPAGTPGGWGGGPPGTVFADAAVAHGGRWSARVERTSSSPGNFASMTLSMPVDFAGKTIELRGFLKTHDVSGGAALWLRQDGASDTVAFDNMQGRQLAGTSDWSEYRIALPIHADARTLFFGVLLAGTGAVWVDDLSLLVDGKPVWEAPLADRPKTVLDQDREFDGGSGVSIPGLTPAQIDNLVTLARVWGFLKYHHPAVAGGSRHWDYDLFRVLPTVLAAPSRAAANAAIAAWVGGLGPVAACQPCATLPADGLHLAPPLEWLQDEARLGADLSGRLREIHRNRPAGGSQFYVSMAPGVGNPAFTHELNYPSVKWPDAGYQVLAAFRFWNIIEYWFPYRDVIGENWDALLARALPRIALASSADAYQLELMALVAAVHDTHANLWSSLRVRPPVGDCHIPVHVRFVDGQPVVVSDAEAAAPSPSGFRPGDVILEMDNTPVAALIERWRPYYAASNEPTRLRDIGRGMTRGACAETTVRVRRDGATLPVAARRVPWPKDVPQVLPHDLPGETFRLLTDQVAYLKLSTVKAADVARHVEAAAGTRGFIVDIRNYPSEFVVFFLGSLLVNAPTPFVRFTQGDLANPGAFRWGPVLSLPAGKPTYTGQIVILVDEVSVSQAEYTAMALRSAPGAIVMGSTTAGADGNVSAIPLPGRLNAMISGIGVFYPDKRPTQRVGILPDAEVRPTVPGIKAGRDEVLEGALRRILGSSTSDAEIERLVRSARTPQPPQRRPDPAK